jgi:DNA-binding NarL/FixJ family response regulator
MDGTQGPAARRHTGPRADGRRPGGTFGTTDHHSHFDTAQHAPVRGHGSAAAGFSVVSALAAQLDRDLMRLGQLAENLHSITGGEGRPQAAGGGVVHVLCAAHRDRRADEPASAEPADDKILTVRQLEILRLLAGGLSNRIIARRLGIAEKTVKNHMQAIFTRLEVADRTQAALYAVRNNLVG